MGRAENRALKKKGYTDRDIRAIQDDALYKKAFEEGVRQGIRVFYYMSAYTINYKLDFGRTRLQRIMGYIINNVDAYRTGHLTAEDFRTIQEEMHNLGIKMLKG